MLGLGRCMPPMPQRIIGNKYSMRFDGINDYGYVDLNPDLNMTAEAENGWTICYWVKNHYGVAGLDDATHFQVVDKNGPAHIKLESDDDYKFMFVFKASDGTRYTCRTSNAVSEQTDWTFVVASIGYYNETYRQALWINGERATVIYDEASGGSAGQEITESHIHSDNAFDSVIFGAQYQDDGGNPATESIPVKWFKGSINDIAFFTSLVTDNIVRQWYYAQSEFDFEIATGYYVTGVRDMCTSIYIPTLYDDSTTIPCLKSSAARRKIVLENGAGLVSDTPRQS
jgi:hypothetical protein